MIGKQLFQFHFTSITYCEIYIYNCKSICQAMSCINWLIVVVFVCYLFPGNNY